MTAATLTEDQRWLLYVAARHVMPMALIDPGYGIPSLRQSHAGGCWPPGRDHVPGWLNSYQVTQSGIAGGEAPGLTRVTVTWGQLKRFARDLPVELRAVLMEARKADRNNVDDAMLIVLGLADTEPGRCATSLDEFIPGQDVKIVVGMGCLKPGVVEHVGRNNVEVKFAGGRGLYRPYELIPGPVPAVQLELFGATP